MSAKHSPGGLSLCPCRLLIAVSSMLALSALAAVALSPPSHLSRREAMTGAASFLGFSPIVANAADVRKAKAPPGGGGLVPIYFGAGCFWHVQHELVLFEQATLGRAGAEISAITGYAGGTRLGSGGRVCYHNTENIADYGRLGHAEVVLVRVPPDAVGAFASKYFGIFGKRGFRHDPQDQGGEYRSVLGLPGGAASPHYAAVEAAAAGTPMVLRSGEGDEGDTLASKNVLVMDSDVFPFHRAEVYHQFHDDFQGPPYGAAYNNLRATLRAAGEIDRKGCPDIA